MSDWVLSLRGESRSLKRRNESSWVGDNTREKMCVAEINIYIYTHIYILHMTTVTPSVTQTMTI